MGKQQEGKRRRGEKGGKRKGTGKAARAAAVLPEDAAPVTGCWIRFPRLRGCMSSRAKVDSATSARGGGGGGETKPATDDGCQDQSVPPASGSTTTSNTGSISPSSIVGEELKLAFQLRRFTFNELKCATRNFRPESLLGEGGFGCVFKGWIEENGTAPVKPGTGLTVAVKTLNHDGLQGHKEWVAEVDFLGNLQHPHLVKLVGYCIEDDQRLLVYEFMPRGSLENHLFRKSLPLPWAIRMKIALGAAKGLAFLHEEAERPVIYRDFKTSNILLDADYNAKLSDFGLAKDGPEGDKTHVSTRVMGTYGYAAPEYVMTGGGTDLPEQLCLLMVYGCHYFWHLRFFRHRLMLLVLCAAVMVTRPVGQELAACLRWQHGNQLIVDVEKCVVNVSSATVRGYVLRWRMCTCV